METKTARIHDATAMPKNGAISLLPIGWSRISAWMTSIFTHISASAPQDEGEHAFLINPFGLRFNEVRASNLVAVDLDGYPARYVRSRH